MATTHVMYGGSRLIPAPFVSFSKEYQTTDDGEKIGSLFSIQVIGTIVAFKGSPDSDGTFWTAGDYPPDETVNSDARLASIIRKQEALRELFADWGKTFEVQSADGSQPMKFNPRNINITFSDDIWFDRCDYTITMEADVVSVNGVALGEDGFTEYISSANENWDIETNEEADITSPGLSQDLGINQTYRISHTISAVGKRFYDSTGNLQKPAWQQARDWVLPRLGFDSTIALSSGVNNLPSYYQGLNHVRNETIGENNGSYSVTETWVLASGTAIENFTVETVESLEDGLSTVSVQGNIRGLEVRNSNFEVTKTKWASADEKFVQVSGLVFSRAQSYSGLTLNNQKINSTIGRNPVAGTINYNFQYNDRPSNLFSDAKSEVVSVNDSFGASQIATIFVLGRTKGPVLQNLGTAQKNTRTLSVEVVFGPAYIGGGTATNRFVTQHPRNNATTLAELTSLISAVEPVNAGMANITGGAASVSYVTNQNENWDGVTGRYSYSTEWTWE